MKVGLPPFIECLIHEKNQRGENLMQLYLEVQKFFNYFLSPQMQICKSA
jgi:hypothetical protein